MIYNLQKIKPQGKITVMAFLVVFISFLSGCNSDDNENNNGNGNPTPEISFYRGADLSYVNEMEDCGAIYKDVGNTVKDPYVIFKEAGTNLVRFRLWHNPDWTNYSNLEDVKRGIARAKEQNLKVLLDFHYSDTWADPSAQQIPAAWLPQINNTEALGELLYNYTLDTLNELAQNNLTPDMVQVGNEINAMILQDGELQWPINWERNAFLINKGLSAVRDFSAQQTKHVEIMLHIAQPENALWWFEQATANNVINYDWIGISYYPQWSTYNLNTIGDAISTLINTYDKQVMIVETAYPYTLVDVDQANNILGNSALIPGYPATQQGQLNYLMDLTQAVNSAGGKGVVYWEPAWVSTSCSTLWGQGSHWDNATLFDHDYKATLGLQFYNLNIN